MGMSYAACVWVLVVVVSVPCVVCVVVLCVCTHTAWLMLGAYGEQTIAWVRRERRQWRVR